MDNKITSIHIPDFIRLLSKYQINEHQFIICWIIHTKDTATMYKYLNEVSHIRQDDIEDLLDRGIVLNTARTRTYELDCMTLNGEFADGLFLFDAKEAGEELWRMFPVRFYTRTGDIFPAKTVRNRTKLLESYVRNGIGYNANEHDRVLKLTTLYLQMVHDGELLGMGIEKYIESKYWEQVEEVAKELGYDTGN